MDSPAADITDPKMRQLFDYWRRKCVGDRLPGRRDIDPLDIPDLLPHITLYDVVPSDDDMKFRIRLLGTANVQLMGGDCTGKFLHDQLRPEDVTRIVASFRQVVEQAKPHFWRSFLSTPGREHIHYERMLLPLAADGRTVDMVLGLFLPVEPPGVH